MLPKLEPRLEAAFLSRQTDVKSINPIGTKQVLPSRMNAGVGPSGVASQGLGAVVDCCAALSTGMATGAIEGMIGVVLATSPSALLRGNAKLSWLSRAGAALAAFSKSFFC